MLNCLVYFQTLRLGKYFAALRARAQRPWPRVSPGNRVHIHSMALVAPGKLHQVHPGQSRSTGGERRALVDVGPTVGAGAVIRHPGGGVPVHHVPHRAHGRPTRGPKLHVLLRRDLYGGQLNVVCVLAAQYILELFP